MHIFQGKKFPVGFGYDIKPDWPKATWLRILGQSLLIPVYLFGITLIGPVLPIFRSRHKTCFMINLIYFSVYQILEKYKEEHTNGKVVRDNRESQIDEKFFEFQTEKSTEGLSESCVQFTVQTVFLVLLLFFSLFSVRRKNI